MQESKHHLGDFDFGRYIVRYITVGNLVLLRHMSGDGTMISKRISDDVPPKTKLLNMVITILMHFCSFVSNFSVAIRTKPHVSKRHVT